MELSIAICAVFVLFFFLGFVQSHWIAPGVLFATSLPLIIGVTWNEPLVIVIGGPIAALILYYACFALGHYAGDNWHSRATRSSIAE